MDSALKCIKLGKVSGLDSIIIEQLKYFGVQVRKWLLKLFNIETTKTTNI